MGEASINKLNLALDVLLKNDEIKKSLNGLLLKPKIFKAKTINAFCWAEKDSNSIHLAVSMKMIEVMDERSLILCLLHEFAHLIKGHPQFLLKLNPILFTFKVILFLFFLTSIYSYVSVWPMIGLSLAFAGFISFVAFLIHRRFKRKFEFEADEFVVRKVGKKSFIDVLEVYFEDDLERKLSSSIFDSHPSFKERIERIQKIALPEQKAQ